MKLQENSTEVRLGAYVQAMKVVSCTVPSLSVGAQWAWDAITDADKLLIDIALSPIIF